MEFGWEEEEERGIGQHDLAPRKTSCSLLHGLVGGEAPPSGGRDGWARWGGPSLFSWHLNSNFNMDHRVSCIPPRTHFMEGFSETQ